jgi:hypothetical protein
VLEVFGDEAGGEIGNKGDDVKKFLVGLAAVLVSGVVACTAPPKRMPATTQSAPTAESVRTLFEIMRIEVAIARSMGDVEAKVRAGMHMVPMKGHYNAAQEILVEKFKTKGAVAVEETSWPLTEAKLVTAARETHSQQDIDALMVFYRSDTGRSIVNTSPQVMHTFAPDVIDGWIAIATTQNWQGLDRTQSATWMGQRIVGANLILQIVRIRKQVRDRQGGAAVTMITSIG